MCEASKNNNNFGELVDQSVEESKRVGVPNALLSHLQDVLNNALCDWLQKKGIPADVVRLVDDLIILERLQDREKNYSWATDLAFEDEVQGAVKAVSWGIVELGGEFPGI